MLKTVIIESSTNSIVEHVIPESSLKNVRNVCVHIDSVEIRKETNNVN